MPTEHSLLEANQIRNTFSLNIFRQLMVVNGRKSTEMACDNIERRVMFASICGNYKRNRPHTSREIPPKRNLVIPANNKKRRPRSAMESMDTGKERNSDETDSDNDDKLIRRTNTTSGRHWARKRGVHTDIDTTNRIENISKLRQIFVDTRLKMAALRRFQSESRRVQSVKQKNDQRDVITRRYSADPEMVRRKGTASIRKSRASNCTSRTTTATAHRKAVCMFNRTVYIYNHITGY